MGEDIPLGKVLGFPLSIHWSVLVIMWLFTWSLAATLSDAGGIARLGGEARTALDSPTPEP